MKRLLTLAALLIFVLVLAACSDSPAPLIAPEDGVAGIDYDVSEDLAQEEEGYDYGYDYDFDLDFDLGGGEIWDDMPTFSSWTGEVTEISIYESDPPAYIFLIQGENGSANLITNFNTFFLGEMPEVGDTITGFYMPEAFMALIYPPQFNTSVIVNGEHSYNIAVDRFDEDLISYDGFLMLNIGDDTEIILQDGEAFDCELAHRKLVVLYDISTRSIPAITTPSKIIVLFENITTGPATL